MTYDEALNKLYAACRAYGYDAYQTTELRRAIQAPYKELTAEWKGCARDWKKLLDEVRNDD